MNLYDSLKKLSHHAYLFIGGRDRGIDCVSSPVSAKKAVGEKNFELSIQSEIISVLEELHDIRSNGNPDFFRTSFDTLTIDDARKLKVLHDTKPTSELGKRIFILSMNGITIEAQNALLKLLEEPAPYAHFFLVVPSAHIL